MPDKQMKLETHEIFPRPLIVYLLPIFIPHNPPFEKEHITFSFPD